MTQPALSRLAKHAPPSLQNQVWAQHLQNNAEATTVSSFQTELRLHEVTLKCRVRDINNTAKDMAIILKDKAHSPLKRFHEQNLFVYIQQFSSALSDETWALVLDNALKIDKYPDGTDSPKKNLLSGKIASYILHKFLNNIDDICHVSKLSDTGRFLLRGPVSAHLQKILENPVENVALNISIAPENYNAQHIIISCFLLEMSDEHGTVPLEQITKFNELLKILGDCFKTLQAQFLQQSYINRSQAHFNLISQVADTLSATCSFTPSTATYYLSLEERINELKENNPCSLQKSGCLRRSRGSPSITHFTNFSSIQSAVYKKKSEITKDFHTYLNAIIEKHKQGYSLSEMNSFVSFAQQFKSLLNEDEDALVDEIRALF